MTTISFSLNVQFILLDCFCVILGRILENHYKLGEKIHSGARVEIPDVLGRPMSLKLAEAEPFGALENLTNGTFRWVQVQDIGQMD